MSNKKCGRNIRDIRTEQIPIRFSAAERETVIRTAQQEHEYASTYLRRIVLKHLEHIEQVTEPREVQAVA